MNCSEDHAIEKGKKEDHMLKLFMREQFEEILAWVDSYCDKGSRQR
jgi:hypothetical protein